MSDEALGFLIVFSCLGLLMFIGGLLAWPVKRFSVLKAALKSIAFGSLLVVGYTVYGVVMTDASAFEILSLQIDPTEVKRMIGLRSIFPAHLIGYVFIVGGLGYLPLAAWLRTDAKNS